MKTRQWWLIVFGIVISLIFFLPFVSATTTRPLHPDEYIFIRRGVFATYYFTSNFRDPIWQSFDSYDVPKFAELFYGVVTKLAPESSAIEQRILFARQAAVFFALGSFCVLFWLCAQTKHWLWGVLAVSLVGSNILLKESLVTAMGDGPLLFFSLLYIGCAAQLFATNSSRRFRRMMFCGAALSAGLATATKLNGVINVFHFCLLTLIFFRHDLIRALRYVLLFIAGSFLTFFILNPFIWKNPILNLAVMVAARQVSIERQQILFPDALSSLSDRLITTYERTLAPQGIYANFANLPAAVPVGLLLFLTGFFLLGKEAHATTKTSHFRPRLAIFFSWIVAWLVVTVLLIPLDWDRYYLPVVISVSCFQSYTLAELLQRTYRKALCLIR